jgi:hypothetical protein
MSLSDLNRLSVRLGRFGRERPKAAALASLAFSLVAMGQLEDAIQLGRQALAMAEALGLDRERLWALGHIGVARRAAGDPEAIEDFDQAVTVAVQANLPTAR